MLGLWRMALEGLTQLFTLNECLVPIRRSL